MTTALSGFMSKFRDMIGENLSGTTDSDGNAAKTNFIDSSLAEYDDNYFGDVERNTQWQSYIASELRTIKLSQSSGGVCLVYKAFSAQVKSGVAYELYKFDRTAEMRAINLALNQAYPWFYQLVSDESTLTGTGGSDNDYAVPATFEEFPDYIYEKKVSGNKVTYDQITNLRATNVGGTRYFYATITTGNAILLMGKKPLTQFDITDDTSETELTDGQAHTVCLLAAAIFFRARSTMVNAEDAKRFRDLASDFDKEWDDKKMRTCMEFLGPKKVNLGWLKG